MFSPSSYCLVKPSETVYCLISLLFGSPHSVFTVTGISMTYFLITKFAVANPRMLAQVSRHRRKVVFLGGVWAVALLLSIPTVLTRQVRQDAYYNEIKQLLLYIFIIMSNSIIIILLLLVLMHNTNSNRIRY